MQSLLTRRRVLVASGEVFVVEFSCRHAHYAHYSLSLSDLIEGIRALFFENAKIARLGPPNGRITREHAIPSQRCPQ